MRKFLLVVAALALVAGCKKSGEMAERQKAAFDQKRQAIQAEVDKVLAGWLAEMDKNLPQDVKKYEKVKSPLVRWRLDSFNYDWRRPMDAAVIQAKDSPVEKDFKALPAFFETQEKFWKKEVDFKDYMEAYDKLKTTVKDDLAIYLADFDHTFVHLEAFYGAQDMEGDDRAVYMFRHWQVAFRFPREKSEAVAEYLNRLCLEKMKAFCQTVPFESLHFALEKPYLTEVKRIVGEFLKAHPDGKLNRIFTPFLADVDARLAKIPDFPEVPVMPTSISKNGYVGDVPLVITRKGIEWDDTTVLKFGDNFATKPADWKDFDKAIQKKMPDLEKERGPENLEVVLAAMDKDAPMSVPAAIVEVMKKQPSRNITFGARRRMDGMNRRTVVGKLAFREVPIEARKVEVEGVGKLTCKPLGQWDEAQDLTKKIAQAAWIDNAGVKVGAFADNKATGLAKVEPAKGAPAVDAGKGPAILLVAADTTYEKFLGVLEPLFLKCASDKCDFVDAQAPKIEIQVCGK